MGIKNDLTAEFNSQLEEVSRMEVGGEKYKIAIDGLTKLADRIIEIEKHEQEAAFNSSTHTNDHAIKTAQLADEKHDRRVRNGIEAVKVVGGFGLAAWAFVASMNFEKEGTLTTEGGRSALRQLLKFVK